MKVGVLSDTHGDIRATKRAGDFFVEQKVTAVFHCGDIGSMEVLVELASLFQPLNTPVYTVLGNVDMFSREWHFFPKTIGVELLGRSGEVEWGGKQIAILHGDDTCLFSQQVESGRFDLIFTGHSHCPHDYDEGTTRCLNPGSTTEGRRSPNSCAILDLDSMEFHVEVL